MEGRTQNAIDRLAANSFYEVQNPAAHLDTGQRIQAGVPGEMLP